MESGERELISYRIKKNKQYVYDTIEKVIQHKHLLIDPKDQNHVQSF